MKDIKVNLLALTGFGNIALKTLLGSRAHVLSVYTRQEKGKFPYYRQEQLVKMAVKRGVPVKIVPRNRDWSIQEKADINLAATFHRILHKKHMAKAKININIHPSLLPSYKGPTPTNWMIHNKRKKCGITAHLITESIDEGEIIYQKAYPLNFKADSQLRKFLAQKTKDVVRYILMNYPNYKSIKSKYEKSYYESYYKRHKD